VGEVGAGAGEGEVARGGGGGEGAARALAQLIAARAGSGFAALGVEDDPAAQIAGEELVGDAVGVGAEGAGVGRGGDVFGRPAVGAAAGDVLAGTGGALAGAEGEQRAVGDGATFGGGLEDAAPEDLSGALDLSPVLVERGDHLPIAFSKHPRRLSRGGKGQDNGGEREQADQSSGRRQG
jgi:hypothetical protein